ncbi:hypothetical protein HDU98_005002 [Podochytrium sp. JEL0797]|nr:hypothetical protein HDU98_005002 [Podochytrium sp. JEL0797]
MTSCSPTDLTAFETMVAANSLSFINDCIAALTPSSGAAAVASLVTDINAQPKCVPQCFFNVSGPITASTVSPAFCQGIVAMGATPTGTQSAASAAATPALTTCIINTCGANAVAVGELLAGNFSTTLGNACAYVLANAAGSTSTSTSTNTSGAGQTIVGVFGTVLLAGILLAFA